MFPKINQSMSGGRTPRGNLRVLGNTRSRAMSCPPQMNEKMQKMLQKHRKKVERTEGGEVSEITQEYRKAEGKVFSMLLHQRKRRESMKITEKFESKKRHALISRIKADHELSKAMFLREIDRKTTEFEEELEHSEHGAELNEIYKIKLGDRFSRGTFRENMELALRDIKSIEEFEYLVSDSTSSEEEQKTGGIPGRPNYQVPGKKSLNLPRIGEGDELPFSPLTKKKYYFPKAKKKKRKRSNGIKQKDFDVQNYLRSSIFSRLRFTDFDKSAKRKKKKLSEDGKEVLTPHQERMMEYQGQLYDLVNSPRGRVNKEIAALKKERELRRVENQKKKKRQKEEDEKLKFEDKIDQVVQRCKGCLKSYLFMKHLYDVFLENKREERRLEEFSRDEKSLRFQKMFQRKYRNSTNDKSQFMVLPSVKRMNRSRKGSRRSRKSSMTKKKMNFKEKYRMLLKREKVETKI